MKGTGEAKAGVFLGALLLGAALWTGPAVAGEPADDPASWGAVSAAELERQRGGDGTATNSATQGGTNSINAGGPVTSGDIFEGSHTFDHQVMSLNAINTGNNAFIQQVMAIYLYIN